MTDSMHCGRTADPAAACPECGARITEDCPHADLTPGLLVASAAVSAGTQAGTCEGSEMCGACQ
jgi:hypothetical protein